MTSEDIRAELEREPFIAIRLYLVSGNTIDVERPGEGWMLQNAILITRRQPDGSELYNVVALRNIERLERLGSP